MKKSIKIIVAVTMLLVAFFLNFSPFADGDLIRHPYLETSQDNGFAVVELFTSEGCSSCPPADALMSKIEKETVGKNVYLLAYHVDYWDRLGWKDSFSTAENTDRQYQYAKWMNLGTMYTPQFVVNGTSQFAGDNQSSLYDLVSDALQKKPASALSLSIVEGQTSFEISYQTNKIENNLVLVVALVQRNASTNIVRGENSGRLLNHVQIVQDFTTITLDKIEGSLISNKPENYSDKGWEVIGFIQNTTSGVITAATKAKFNS